MKSLLIALSLLTPSAFASESPESLLAKVAEHCSGPQKCACFATNIDGFHFTFGNGEILSLFPEFSFASKPEEMLSLGEVDSIVSNFKQNYKFEKLVAFCANPGEGDISQFGYDIRYELRDKMFEEQLARNGGFCNTHQKCSCEFDMGGNEMSPNFRKKFEIAVSGSQTSPYDGSSSGGPIHHSGQNPLFVRNLDSVLGKSAVVKERFVLEALKQLEPFRAECLDFAAVKAQGRRTLLALIHDLEHPSDPAN